MSSPAAAFPAPVFQPPGAPATHLEAARERVVRLLTDRYADDSLTVEQFEAALDRMHALATPQALDAMAAELAAPPPAGWLAPPVRRGAVGRVAGLLPARVRAVMSNLRRSGPWVVPPELHVTSVMSEVTMDLREAVLPAECTVEVWAVMGTARLWLPARARVRLEVDAFMAEVSDKSERGVWQDGPLVRVTGTAIMAEVKVRRDDW